MTRPLAAAVGEDLPHDVAAALDDAAARWAELGIADYTFSRGWLKGVRVGGGARYRGRMVIESQTGQGAVFKVLLQAFQKPNQA